MTNEELFQQWLTSNSALLEKGMCFEIHSLDGGETWTKVQ